jgi:hypothetical protein
MEEPHATETLYATETGEDSLLRLTAVERLSLHATAGEPMPRISNAIAYTGGVMYPDLNVANNYQGPVVVDVAGIEIAADTPWNRDHDPKRPVGHSTDVQSDGSQLLYSGFFSLDNDDSREITTGRTFPWKPSVGLCLLEWRMVREGETVFVNGRNFDGPFLLVTRSSLKHIAIVTEPGDTNVDPLLIAQHQPGHVSIMDFAAYVASLGLDLATLTPEATAALQSAYDAMHSGDADSSYQEPDAMDASANAMADPATPVAKAAASSSQAANVTNAQQQETLRAQMRQTIAEEHSRGTAIRTLCARFGNPQVSIGGQTVDLAAHAIANGLTMEQAELHARRHQEVESTRESRSSGPFIHARSRSADGTIETLQAGLLLRAGIALDSPAFATPSIRAQLPGWLRAGLNDAARQRVMDNGHRFQMSLPDACAAALHARGQDVPHARLEMLQASFSTGAVSDLFGTTIGAVALKSYAEIADFSVGWCQEGENPDMELHNRTRLQSVGDLSHHPAGGSADHAHRQSLSEKAKVDRFSRQAEFDEADFMSDNLQLLIKTPREFGFAAGRVRPNLVASLLLSNPTLLVTGRQLFNATDLSVLTGSALNEANLSLAIARMMLKKDGDASINLAATHLIVPPALLDPANRLTTSAEFSNDSGKGAKNVLAAYGIKPVPEARLQNGMIDPISKAALAGSATDYFLVSAEGNTIEVTFLEGAGRVPIVKVEQSTGGKFGMVVTVKHYVGCRALDHLPFVRCSA